MRKYYLLIICILVYIIGCSSFLLPKKQPEDFAFILKYGVGARNELNTYEGTFTKDLVGNRVAKAELKLTPQELKKVYQKLREINILSYPQEYRPDQHLFIHRVINPSQTYYLKLRFNGQEKEMKWADSSLSEETKAKKLRELINYVKGLIEAKSEYKKMPKANGHYL